MTQLLFRDDAYVREASATVLAVGPEGVVLDRTPYYARAGGQPGDAGTLAWDGGETSVVEARKGEGDAVLHVLPEAAIPPPVGSIVTAQINWARRHLYMRMHTALHLLCAALPGVGVTGGQIGADKSRLDFDMAEPPTKEALEAALNALAAGGHAVSDRWITAEELDAMPSLVRTLSVQPPRGAGFIRLVRIGPEDAPIDLQPCGGTHVANTAEIGTIRVTKMESKGRQNRRVSIVLEEI
ncbi:alanyl-tRNA editing protein [Humitalea sp. 24SJ18S-53]|uniref:alanyl-tRNA editing protein n=1 Tax=Humitalea sp. 24SJ18S-53 TaxID=3422307 RepID=UPI003D66B781